MSKDILRDEDLDKVSGGNNQEDKEPKKEGKDPQHKKFKPIDMDDLTKPIEYDPEDDDEDDEDEK